MGKRIIVESGAYGLHNLGDVAMMQVTVERIKDLWPSAEVEVVTYRSDLLTLFCPSAIPIPMSHRNEWLRDRLSGTTDLWTRTKSGPIREEFNSPESFHFRLTTANLLVVSGMGGFNDSFATEIAIPLLSEMEAALEAGVPVIAFGQGIGPISNPLLWERARAVLPRLALISLREGHTGLPLLEALGVTKDRIVVTGDDAIEPAFKLRPSSPGNAIGINLRLAEYAGTNNETADRLAAPLRSVAAISNCPLIPIPIAFGENDSDVKTFERLLGRLCLSSFKSLHSPEDVIRLAGSCRVVVTGSYHGGVFALAQGIPVIALIQSPYYEQKFKGLEAQFPGGCRLLDLRTSIHPDKIQEVILAAMKSAEDVRESLLAAAAKQVQLGREAYQTARRLCERANVYT